ncbi:MAG TPA: DUF58 domain-containing protein [Actinomycetota bacterium]|nr:DUF58 domain-containing protein [Actinomycetota bacterium]
MPTLRGWLVAGTGAALWAIGRIFGADPLEQMALALLALVCVAVLVVRRRGQDLEAGRTVVPERATTGQPVSVTIELHNRSSKPAPLLLVEDRIPLELAGRARFSIAGLEAAGRRSATIQLTPRRRGRYELGPLRVSIVDPFGLAAVHTRPVGSSALLVYPRVEKLRLPREFGHQRTTAMAERRQPTGSRGEDFYTLREYIEGDDLRKIHWPSTAKLQRFMIRQEETPWHQRATVVLDDRSEAHGGFGEHSSFERAVEAAASVLALYERSGYSFAFGTALSGTTPPGRGREHLHRALDLLSELSTATGPHALGTRLAELQAGAGGEGVLIVVTGSADHSVAKAAARSLRAFRDVVVISFPAHRFGGLDTRARWEAEKTTLESVRLITRSGGRAIVLGPGEPLGPVWSGTRGGKREGVWERKPELV